MNTLNNIHALIDIDADSAKRGIVELSGMMRHVVYESTAERIPLSKDVEFLQNYIELMRIRYCQDIEIKFNYPNPMPLTLTVPPLVLIVFVENAFKHGIARKKHSYIHIDIAIEDDSVVARFENSLFQNSSSKGGGVGLDNVSRRLEHIYGDRYTLDIVKSSDSYCVTLKVPIENE